MQSEIRISFLQLLPLHSLSCLAIRWTCLPLRSQSYVMCGKTSWTKIEIRAVHFPPPRKSSSFQGWLLCHLRSRVCYHDLSRYWPFAEINLWMLLHQAGRALDQSHNGFLLFLMSLLLSIVLFSSSFWQLKVSNFLISISILLFLFVCLLTSTFPPPWDSTVVWFPWTHAHLFIHCAFKRQLHSDFAQLR